jgi:hypothetical protein
VKKRLAVGVGGAVVATLAGLAALSLVMAAHPSRAAAATTCTPTNYIRFGINLTAAVVNPSAPVSGNVNAAGCDIGVYYGPGASGTVNGADISNATYYGVVNNGGDVTVEYSTIHGIGRAPGSSYGTAVYWAYQSGATGRIVNNTISDYQVYGIAVNGTGDFAEISGNKVTGLGAVDYTIGYGIQVGYGATANVMRNTVSDNIFSGYYNYSAGIVVVGGSYYSDVYTTNVQIVGNTLTNNDIGVWLSNIDTNYNAATTPTNIKVVNNTISNQWVSNPVYQAGVADQGDNDKIIHNTISGAGYNPASSATSYLIQIDAASSFTNHVKVHANVLK